VRTAVRDTGCEHGTEAEMRYEKGVMLMVPFVNTNEDETTDRMWAKFSFKGNVDRRRVKRELRKWVQRNLQRRLHPIEQGMVMKRATIL
jgi:hypothetical protein